MAVTIVFLVFADLLVAKASSTKGFQTRVIVYYRRNHAYVWRTGTENKMVAGFFFFCFLTGLHGKVWSRVFLLLYDIKKRHLLSAG